MAINLTLLVKSQESMVNGQESMVNGQESIVVCPPCPPCLPCPLVPLSPHSPTPHPHADKGGTRCNS
jgi:hypothetical protein